MLGSFEQDLLQPGWTFGVLALTVLEAGHPRLHTLDLVVDAGARDLPVKVDLGGPACVLVHDEDPEMNDLRQLTFHGSVQDGRFHVEHRSRSLTPTNVSTIRQLQRLRALAREARRNRPHLERWIASSEASRSNV